MRMQKLYNLHIRNIDSEAPLPKDPALFPTFPAKSAGEKRRTYDSPSAPHAVHGGSRTLFDNQLSGSSGAGFQLRF